eukprot:snap_masked-scaffold_56-processed-gene-0.27-mRNA-1 protein AED:1.00 eAED:1.00 QI:0/-1/0/0/-1/1/1/0/227
MSYFHKIPLPVELREEVLTAAEKYFEENDLRISSLSLLSLILPEKKPFTNYPTSNPFTCVYSFLSSAVLMPCDQPTVFDCVEEALIMYPLLASLPCWCWINLGALLDERLKNSVLNRLDLVRLCIAIYQEGIFIYRRKLEKVPCRRCCFCVFSFDNSGGSYGLLRANSVFVSWKDVDLSDGVKPMNEHCDAKDFVRFSLGDFDVKTRREVYDYISKYYYEFHVDSDI